MILGIYGYGKMGQAIHRLSSQYEQISSIEIYRSRDHDLQAFLSKCDVIADFSLASASSRLTEIILQERQFPKALLIGTTDLTDKTRENIELISENLAILQSNNFSIGANLLASLCKKISATLQNYDVDIVEIHHKQKLDSPSGTAKMLAESINEGFIESGMSGHKIILDRSTNPVRSDNEISISSIRAGKATGKHEVIFTGNLDSISISHQVENRDLLADGALKTAMWLSKQKPGLYKINDFLCI